MSKYDQGKHVIGHDENGAALLSKKRLDPQRTPKKLEERQAAFTSTMQTQKDNREGFHKPGSQNRNK